MFAACLDLVGPVEVDDGTFQELLTQAQQGGDIIPGITEESAADRKNAPVSCWH